MPDVSLNGIEFKIRGSSNEASASVQHLIDKVNELRSSMSGLKSVQTTANALKNVGNAAKKAATPLSNFASSLKRIAFYRILRGILKSITQAFKEGLKNAYEFSKATGDQAGLAAALDQLATKSLTMKNQLGAAFGGLLTAITPIVVQIIQLVTKLAEAISRLMAILGGSDTYLRAKDVWTEWGDAAASAGGAAKKALEYLAPFDELNVLPDPKSGGGGGADASNIGDMFEYVNVNDGLGFGDLLIGWYDKIAEFFEGQNWAELADKAWQGLKEMFSDTGKASEVISSLFEALGAAIGGASAFIGEFVANILEDIFAAFKKNLQDYNGDGKISVVEFLGALLTTGLEAYSTIEAWVKDNIVDPFFDGIAKSWGMSGHQELYDAIVNFGIDIANAFIRDVINPLKEKWNEFADWVYEKTHGKVDWRVEMTAEIAHVNTAGLTAAQKVITAMTAGLTSVLDKIPTSKKSVSGMTANLSKAKDSLTTAQRTVPVTGNFTNRTMTKQYKDTLLTFDAKAKFYTRERTDYFKQNYQTFDAKARFNNRERTDYFKNNYQTFDAKARFNERERTDYFKNNWQTFDAKARFNERERTDYFKKNWQTFDAKAKFNSREDALTTDQRKLTTYANMKGRYDNLTTEQRTLTSYANFKGYYNNLTDAQRTFNSTANFTSRADNISTTFASTAYINGYSIADRIKDWNGYLNVDTKVNIVGQTNVPTVAVNASYNTPMVKAMGGAFYGGSWHDIPQYASGGSPHGSLFVAGEAGAELVGHIGGRTEVLNQSQIAASIAAGVHRNLGMVGVTASGGYNLSDGSNEDVLYRAFRRALDETDFGGDVELDGDTIYRAMVRRNRANTRLTGVNAMA